MSLLILLFYVLNITSNFQINSSHFFRLHQTTSFRLIATTPPFEICGIAKSTSKLGSVWKHYLDLVLKKYSLKELTCPVRYCKLYNVTTEHPFHVYLPSGEYKNVVQLSNNEDDLIFKYSYNAILKTSTNDNF